MTEQDLQTYIEAWNAHDIDRVMAMMTPECEFITGGGQQRFGTRYVGASAVRQRIQDVWIDMPDVQFVNVSHFVTSDRACSQWTIVGTRGCGQRIEVDGCDVLTLDGDLIAVKNSFIKQVS